MVPYIISENSISVFLKGKIQVCDNTHPNYETVREELLSGTATEEILHDLLNIGEMITKNSEGVVEVQDGVVYYAGEPVHNALTSRILSMIAEGHKVDPFIQFMENLMENPYPRIREQLYTFLEKSSLPITEDGCFLAYKIVRNNYMDIYTGSINNTVGSVVKMDPVAVDKNPDRTCSVGLHFCSYSYLPHFGYGGTNIENENHDRIMVLKVNPANVASIPVDYDFAKGRCWEYEVIGEIPPDQELKAMFAETREHADPDVYPEYLQERGDEDDWDYEDWEDEDDWDDEDDYYDPLY